MINLEGKKFGYLTVLCQQPGRIGGQIVWMCSCDCGGIRYTTGSNLRLGKTKSCGCLLGKHKRKAPGESAFNKLYRDYRRQALARGLEWNLDNEQVRRLFKQDCYYCGQKPSQIGTQNRSYSSFVYNGIDRVDNTKGYDLINVVSCCGTCNRAKGTMHQSEFFDWIERIYSYRHKDSYLQ